MPRGWYLAQGLVPLGYSSSDDEEGPCELPDGRLVCGPHGLVVCGLCCMDFSFMEQDAAPDDEEGDSEEWNPPLTKGTGRAFPSQFIPPSHSIRPLQLFSRRKPYSSRNRFRFCHRDDAGIFLIFTDGACTSNGQAEPRGAWALVDGEDGRGEPEKLAGRLEDQGPFGACYVHTNNRAELRAVLAALRSYFGPSEGFHTVVVATDSEYVAEGATAWARNWVRNSWQTRAGKNVKNRDLWQVLLGEVERCERHGLAVKFWRIRRDWNTDADAAAKHAADTHPAVNVWKDTTRCR